MSDRRNGVAFAVLAAACLLFSGAYVAWAALRGESGATAASRPQLRAVTAGPFVTFLSSASGRRPYDQLAVAPLAHPERRLLVGLKCDRVAMAGDVGICVRHSVRAFGAGFSYRVHYFGKSFSPYGSAGSWGIPSRARVSPSGELAAVTSFLAGHSYETAGGFSTTTRIFSPRSHKPVVDTLEEFHVFKNGERFEPVNRNFWGVTFADDRYFYATMGTGKETFLIRGDLADRVVTTVHANVECPSLSPDRTRVAFKKRGTDNRWRFAVLELATGRETLLAERRSIDDQLAWADPSHVLYGGPGGVWMARADGTGTPRLFLANASSPTVVR